MRQLQTTLAGFALALLLISCGNGANGINVSISAVVADTADYTIDRIQILPAPPQPGAGTLQVRIVYTLNQTGGNVSPLIWLYDDDDFLRFGDDGIAKGNFVEGALNTAPGQYDGIISFVLTCDGDEVVGPTGEGTGEGHKEWWGSINEAEIMAAAQRQGGVGPTVVSGSAVELWCE